MGFPRVAFVELNIEKTFVFATVLGGMDLERIKGLDLGICSPVFFSSVYVCLATT